MAYDPNDPADKKLVEGLIKKAVDAAVATATEEANEAHETEVAGLKANRDRLKADLKKARAGQDGEDHSAEIERLEGELSTTKANLTKLTKDHNKLVKDHETVTTERDGLNKSLTSTLVDGGLSSELAAAGVDAKFLPAVKALLSPKVTVETVGDDRRAIVDGKPLGEFIKTWSQGDEGKTYVVAPGNSGGGQGGSQGGQQGQAKTMTRSAYEAANKANPASTAAFFADGGKLVDG